MILVNNKLDTQFFVYVYLYSLHISGNHVPIIRRIIVSIRHLVYVTLCRWLAHQTVIYADWHNLGVALIQLILLIMGTWLPETCR